MFYHSNLAPEDNELDNGIQNPVLLTDMSSFEFPKAGNNFQHWWSHGEL